ncbi:hypothetical protein M406DRAFT_358522 [Cryphonectria parasitica EP155]|uniref:Urease accessory protein UreF n=1 Tax=Cryphonectria parasitica (strain ATCC 38755 / EP155) TaxID=660469 RepID=A0A9P5CHW3_CRYP1|nr:uncharacterized protein M406DRAFT_358522 [Cryphonectria parasitica EP155]KAF3760173.1 hypothetical protein M406DRAFT_358522 [Cryphonectria parasitica EP155]
MTIANNLSMSSKPAAEPDNDSTQLVQDEILELEARLARAKARLKKAHDTNPVISGAAPHDARPTVSQQQEQTSFTLASRPTPPDTTTHFLLLLSDSALPLGSFAFSSGLESYLAHSRANSFRPSSQTGGHAIAPFDLFLPLSLSSYASTTLPFLLAAHRSPARLAELDDALDAAVVCTVGKRASTAQGRALLGIWDRSFALSSSFALLSSSSSSSSSQEALQALASYSELLRSPTLPGDGTGLAPVAAHLAPLFGLITSIVGLSLHQAAYVFMLGHVKALVSAAVRANLMGPYAAQKVLASADTQAMITAAIEREWDTPPEEAGQSVPVMDLWVGRHELLYSRIFNS